MRCFDKSDEPGRDLMKTWILPLLFTVFILGCVQSPSNTEQTTSSQKPVAIEIADQPIILPKVIIPQVGLEIYGPEPANVTVSANQTVEWINKDDRPKVLAFGDGEITDEIPPGGTFRKTFEKTGEYLYAELDTETNGYVIVK